MARPLRLERPGAWYHVSGRGVERRAIFRDDRDRRRWLALIAEAVPMFRWLVHGYVLMDNHYHLILQIQETNLSRGMQWFQTSYSMAFNRRHGRVGPLVQGRFHAVLVDRIGWGLELSRYVHLNPVRTAPMGLDKQAQQAGRMGVGGRPDARQVRERLQRLGQYPWSSYRAYVGLEKAPEWLTCEAVLALGGRGTLRERQAAYRKYVEEAIREGLEASPWEHLEGGVDSGHEAVCGSGAQADWGFGSGTTATPGPGAPAIVGPGPQGGGKDPGRAMEAIPGSARGLGAGLCLVFGTEGRVPAFARAGKGRRRIGLCGGERGGQTVRATLNPRRNAPPQGGRRKTFVEC
jgi:REP element-mobilizing transposase RayT